MCRFYREYGRCRFNPCSYQHDILLTASVKEMKDKLEKKDEEIGDLKILQNVNVKKLEEFKEKIINLEKIVMKLNAGNDSTTKEMKRCESKVSSGRSLVKYKVLDENGYPACLYRAFALVLPIS